MLEKKLLSDSYISCLASSCERTAVDITVILAHLGANTWNNFYPGGLSNVVTQTFGNYFLNLFFSFSTS